MKLILSIALGHTSTACALTRSPFHAVSVREDDNWGTALRLYRMSVEPHPRCVWVVWLQHSAGAGDGSASSMSEGWANAGRATKKSPASQALYRVRVLHRVCSVRLMFFFIVLYVISLFFL